jgi:hypothetical protein
MVIEASMTSLVVSPVGLAISTATMAVLAADVAERYVPGVAGALSADAWGVRGTAARTTSGSGTRTPAGMVTLTSDSATSARPPHRRIAASSRRGREPSARPMRSRYARSVSAQERPSFRRWSGSGSSAWQRRGGRRVAGRLVDRAVTPVLEPRGATPLTDRGTSRHLRRGAASARSSWPRASHRLRSRPGGSS